MIRDLWHWRATIFPRLLVPATSSDQSGFRSRALAEKPIGETDKVGANLEAAASALSAAWRGTRGQLALLPNIHDAAAAAPLRARQRLAWAWIEALGSGPGPVLVRAVGWWHAGATAVRTHRLRKPSAGGFGMRLKDADCVVCSVDPGGLVGPHTNQAGTRQWPLHHAETACGCPAQAGVAGVAVAEVRGTAPRTLSLTRLIRFDLNLPQQTHGKVRIFQGGSSQVVVAVAGVAVAVPADVRAALVPAGGGGPAAGALVPFEVVTLGGGGGQSALNPVLIMRGEQEAAAKLRAEAMRLPGKLAVEPSGKVELDVRAVAIEAVRLPGHRTQSASHRQRCLACDEPNRARASAGRRRRGGLARGPPGFLPAHWDGEL